MKKLLLLGGGHAHVHVLDALGRAPFHDTAVTLVSPYPRQIYSGMLPGWITGHYTLDDCAIPINTIAAAAGVEFIQTRCISIDLNNKTVECANGSSHRFDIISIDTGSDTALDAVPGATQFAIPIRPIEDFIARWPQLLEQARTHIGDFRLAIVGDGAAGTELAFAIRRRFRLEGLERANLVLIGSEELPLIGFPDGFRRKTAALLRKAGVERHANQRVSACTANRLVLTNNESIPVNASLWVTGAAAPQWPKSSGLATNNHGFIRVTAALQSISHPFVFAAGDIAAYAEARPKSGVFAVRAGPQLARNLSLVCQDQAPETWAAQRQAMYLISTGEIYALGIRGGLYTWGTWLWILKDWIDRRFMRRFS